MTDWRPIYCRYCHGFHEQPYARDAYALCVRRAYHKHQYPIHPVWCLDCRSWHEWPEANHSVRHCEWLAIGEVILRPKMTAIYPAPNNYGFDDAYPELADADRQWSDRDLPLDPADFPELSEKA